MPLNSAHPVPMILCAPSTVPPVIKNNDFLHGSTYHGCLLISETSCEQQNDFLDRALVVQTVENSGAEFFQEKILGAGTATLTSAV